MKFTEIKSGPHICDFTCYSAKPSLAIVASDGRRAVILDFVGGALDYWISEGGDKKSFDGVGAGVWIWEGTVVGTRDYWGEYDERLEGDFRELTDEEWGLLQDDDVLWDAAEWEACPALQRDRGQETQ